MPNYLYLIIKSLKNHKIKEHITWLVLIIGGYLVLFVFRNIPSGHVTICLFKRIFNYPCPGCGIGRATMCFWSGDWLGAWDYNILSIPLNIFLIISLIGVSYDLIKHDSVYLKYINKKKSKNFYFILFLLVIISWITNIYRGI